MAQAINFSHVQNAVCHASNAIQRLTCREQYYIQTGSLLRIDWRILQIMSLTEDEARAEAEVTDILGLVLGELELCQPVRNPRTFGAREALRRTLIQVDKDFSENLLARIDALLARELTQKALVDVKSLTPCCGDRRLCLWQGDITLLKSDAVVNAANDQGLGCFQPLHRCVDNVTCLWIYRHG